MEVYFHFLVAVCKVDSESEFVSCQLTPEDCREASTKLLLFENMIVCQRKVFRKRSKEWGEKRKEERK